jgi:hypothetical protein
MTRIDLSDRIFRAAWAVKRSPTTIRLRLAEWAQRAAYAAGDAVNRLGALVRGCGCDDDDPECCRRDKGDWCMCNCHDANTRLRAEETMQS